jgi:hypothetical protein
MGLCLPFCLPFLLASVSGSRLALASSSGLSWPGTDRTRRRRRSRRRGAAIERVKTWESFLWIQRQIPVPGLASVQHLVDFNGQRGVQIIDASVKDFFFASKSIEIFLSKLKFSKSNKDTRLPTFY